VQANRGAVNVEIDIEDHPVTDTPGAADFRPNGLRLLNLEQFNRHLPSFNFPKELSPRGKVSRDRFLGKRRLTMHERVATQLFSDLRGNDASDVFVSFDASAVPEGFDEIEVPEEKLTLYLLNKTHVRGGDKARVFSDELGINNEDWRYLAAQIARGLKQTAIRKVLVKSFESTFGIRYSAVIAVKGLNGKTATIETGWIVNPGERARFVTAFPAKREDRLDVRVESPPVIPTSLRGDARWNAIFLFAEIAGSEEADRCVPTPMKVEGEPVIMEGMSGGAYIHVGDARTGFARWAIKSGKGYKHFKSGTQIYAKVFSQSVDRAIAYCRAFATVLRENGISCDVVDFLD
jgi:hypothetical protein